MPMFHIGGLGLAAVGTIMQRGTHVLLLGFDPSLVIKLFECEKATFSLLVPTMIEAVINRPRTGPRLWNSPNTAKRIWRVTIDPGIGTLSVNFQ